MRIIWKQRWRKLLTLGTVKVRATICCVASHMMAYNSIRKPVNVWEGVFVATESNLVCSVCESITPSSLVTVSLTPAGSAPLLKQKKFKVDRERTVGWIMQWLQKTLKCEPDESVVSHVN